MIKVIPVAFYALAIQFLLAQSDPSSPKPAASWSFDDQALTTPGVVGKAMNFDGFASVASVKPEQAPKLDGAFTIEAWVAPQVYPWDWAAIANQERDHKEGWFFGVGHDGRVGMHVAKDGNWIECNSKTRLPLLKWSHVMGSYDPASGLKVYVNGKLEGKIDTKGPITQAAGQPLWIGRSHTKSFPVRTEREFSKTFLSPMVFDGLIDEVKIFTNALSDVEATAAFASVKPAVEQPLQYRRLPAGPDGPADFGAVYTRLNYAPEWERYWRVGDTADILVRFDENPTKIIFWRGMNYGACYVSENGLWAGDQSLEVNSHEKGCFEHMGDKHCERSHARIIESNDARVVVHARYACTGIDGSFLVTDPDTRWGIWADEYFSIYPDGVAVRHVEAPLHNGSGQWQETILFNQPGSRPEDTVDIKAFSLANTRGESHTYSWENGQPIKYSEKLEERMFPKPVDANIQMVNFRSQWKPFIIFEPEPKIQGFGIPESKEYSNFPCWNHWPVAQLPNDGRKAIVSDRPSHFTLSTSVTRVHRDEKGASATWLYGLTDKPITNLVPLEKSWNSAPAVTLQSEGFEEGAFEKSERAFVFTAKNANADAPLDFRINASTDSPLFNPAFVVKNWGKKDAKLLIDGKEIPRGKDFRLGHRQTIDGTNLIVWLKLERNQPTKISLHAVK